jgi:hypothetical protein
MTGRLASGAAWLAGATLLLSAGFLLFAFALARLTGADTEARAALALWTQIVLVKGLLPQLWLCLALFAIADRRLGLRARGGSGLAAGLAVAALLAGIPVAAWLLTLDLPQLPAVVFRDAANFAATVVEMSVPVWLAGWLSARVVGARAGAGSGRALPAE